MKITENKIDELSHLCRLEFKPREKKAIKQDLERILDFCRQLEKVDTSNVEPLVYMTPEQNNLRPDKAEKTIAKKQGLKNAPSADGDYFKVPKVINK